jgi:hypothetical protein
MKTLLGLALALALVFPLAGSGRAGPPAASQDAAQVTATNIARVTTNLLGHSQFAHHPLDAELAGRLLDRYLDALDGTRSLFLQSDVDELSWARAKIPLATCSASGSRSPTSASTSGRTSSPSRATTSTRSIASTRAGPPI